MTSLPAAFTTVTSKFTELCGRPKFQLFNSSTCQRSIVSAVMLAMLLVVVTPLATATPLETVTFAQEDEDGYIYTVQQGDNWALVADRVGLSVEDLQAANPEAVRQTGWLIVGEKLLIPTEPQETERFYEVQTGEGWTSIAERFDLNVRLLQAVNPRLVRADQVLYAGDRLLIPPQAQAPVQTETATLEPPEASADPDQDDTAAEDAGSDQPETTQTEIDSTGEDTADQEERNTALAAAGLPTCPSSFSILPERFVRVLNRDADRLSEYMSACGVAEGSEMIRKDLTGDQTDELVLVYHQPADASVFRRGELAIIQPTAAGEDEASSPYEVSFVAAAAGTVALVAAEDVNADGQTDVAWIDTTCGASTCFDTVYVRSWNGDTWQDWTDGTITMAHAEVELADVDETGEGQELQLTGGQYGSFGAGPQRQRTETWGSLDGGPYRLLSRNYGESDCLYHQILDAERAFTEALDLQTAESLYEEAFGDPSLIACWTRPDELEELQSFALFRLALIRSYQNDHETAHALIEQLLDSYPDMPYAEVGARWLEALDGQSAALEDGEAGSVQQACHSVNEFVMEDGAAVEILEDYGYANPSFTAHQVCPVLNVETSQGSNVERLTGETLADETVTDETLADEGVGDTAASSEDSDREEASAPEMPNCPPTLDDFATTLPELFTITTDPLAIETWMRLCEGLSDDRGALIFNDLNDDGQDDILAFPSIISDLGYGPGGAEGTLLVYHGQQGPSGSGTYTTALTAEAYGKPTPLAVGDANQDGAPELLWKVESCATFCVASVQSITWDEESGTYVSGILPGATIAEGDVFVEAATTAVGRADPGNGRQLRLVGGVSGTPNGGLQVPHEEIWQSIEGQPFQRISWIYDREAEHSDCLGLRLIEADVAMQSENVLGYEPAIVRYSAALNDSDLRACSVFDMEVEEELALLRGLAGFRLVQAQALDGNVNAAENTLEELIAARPDADYTEAARVWLESYSAQGEDEQDPGAACDAVTDIFTENPDLWQVTDHFGYDHPALAAEQICYSPKS